MLKTNLTTDNAWKATTDQSFLDAATAIIKLDLPEERFMLQTTTCAVLDGGWRVISPTNFDDFNQLID